jgi:hypothetical protein
MDDGIPAVCIAAVTVGAVAVVALLATIRLYDAVAAGGAFREGDARRTP